MAPIQDRLLTSNEATARWLDMYSSQAAAGVGPFGIVVLDEPVILNLWGLLFCKCEAESYGIVNEALFGWEKEHVEWIIKEHGVPHPPRFDNVRSVEAEGIFVAFPGVHTYGHWLIDILPRIDFARKVLGSHVKIIIPTPTKEWFWPLLALIGVSRDDIIIADTATPLSFSRVYIPNLMKRGWKLSSEHFRTFQRMRNNASALCPKVPTELVGGRYLYVKKTTLTSIVNQRVFLNEQEVLAVVVDTGGIIFDPLEYSFLEQIAVFRAYDFIVGEDSSALHNVVFREPSDLLIITSPSVQNLIHVGVQDILGGRFGLVCAEEAERGSVVDVRSVFSLRPDDLVGAIVNAGVLK